MKWNVKAVTCAPGRERHGSSSSSDSCSSSGFEGDGDEDSEIDEWADEVALQEQEELRVSSFESRDTSYSIKCCKSFVDLRADADLLPRSLPRPGFMRALMRDEEQLRLLRL